MPKAHIHSKISAKRFGGIPEDYMDIHLFMDSSKGVVADHRHRAVFHNSFAISYILPRIFGETRTNSDGKVYSTRDVFEQHCQDDFGFIPTLQDFLCEMEYRPWMNNGMGRPPSCSKLKMGPNEDKEDAAPTFEVVD